MNKSVLNQMLANACPIMKTETGLWLFRIGLHCVDIVIIAQSIGEYSYDVIDSELSEEWTKTSDLEIYKAWEDYTK